MSPTQSGAEPTTTPNCVQNLALSKSDSPLSASLPQLLLPTEELPSVYVGIQAKLVALMVAMSFLIVGVLASYFPARQISELRLGLQERATMYGRLASLQLRSAVAFGDQQTAREVLGAIAKDPLVLGVAIYTEGGARLESEGKLSELAYSARYGLGELRTFSLPGRVLVASPVRSLEGPRGTLLLELSTGSAIAARNRLIRAALMVGAAALLFGAASAWAIARSLAVRVERIARAASAVAKGDLEQRLVLDGARDEIGVLAHGFDAMVRRLRDLIHHIHEAAAQENKRLEVLVQQRTGELDRRNADLRLVLDNVEQGFVTIDREGIVVGERSRVIDVWLGTLAVGKSLWVCLDALSPGVGAAFEAAWSQVIDDIMPAELCLAQMPRRVTAAGRHLRFDYQPLGSDEQFAKLLVVISDATAAVERDRMEQEEKDILSVTSKLLDDRSGFLEFFGETQALLERVTENESDLVLLKRDLHTLKGNTAIFGLSLVSELCHAAESELETFGAKVIDCSPIVLQWERIALKIRQLLGQRLQHGIEIEEREYLALLDAVQRGADRGLLERMVRAWRLEPLRIRLERAGEQLSVAVSRLGKGAVRVVIDSPAVYLARDELTEFWNVFAHVVRNAAVHGLEQPDERGRRGKSVIGCFTLRAGVADSRLFVELEDPGPGVDWDAVRARAAQQGLPSATEADLVNALFTDGISTKDGANEMSGRGVGLSAVRAACERKRGLIDVATTEGLGTKFRFSWPTNEFRSFTQLDIGESP